MKRMKMEIGGKDEGIVMKDEEKESIEEGILWGDLINRGKKWEELKRIYVNENIYEDVWRNMKEYEENIIIGEGIEEKRVIGKVKKEMKLKKVREIVEDEREKGERIMIGGEEEEGKGYLYKIKIVEDIEKGKRMVDEEKLGKVMKIIRYRDIDEVIRSEKEKK